MQLIVESNGCVRCIYGEAIDLRALGPLSIMRASHVEPDVTGGWLADMAQVGGPALGPFHQRSQALQAESTWLENHWLHPNPRKE